MTLAIAQAFVERVLEKTGRHPVINAPRSFLTDSLVPKKPSALAQCPLRLWYFDGHPEKHSPGRAVEDVGPVVLHERARRLGRRERARARRSQRVRR